MLKLTKQGRNAGNKNIKQKFSDKRKNFINLGYKKGSLKELLGEQVSVAEKQLKSHGSLYDYGARMYDTQLGRWWAMDNKAEKYFSWSTYTYTLNNPVRYIDPDGNVIVDPKGRPITYSKEKGWSPNATKDVIRIGNAMMATRTGRQQWNAMTNASHLIILTISSTDKTKTNPDGSKSYKLGNCLNTISVNPKTGKATVTKSVITIYEGTINTFINDTRNSQDSKAVSYQENSTNNDQRIAAVAGHESVHATDQNNIQQSVDNKLKGLSNDVEAEPNKIEIKILEETGIKNMKPIEPIIIEKLPNMIPTTIQMQ